MKTFDQMNLSKDILMAIEDMKYEFLTEIQERSIPEALKGKNLIIGSRTGSGKTASFLIPLIERTEKNDWFSSLILSPTRELAKQTDYFCNKLGKYKNLRTALLYGGRPVDQDIEKLGKKPHIIIGTPGRILDLIKRGSLDLSKIKIAVLDEADTMLDMGFIDDIVEIFSEMPSDRQVMMLSATINRETERIAHRIMDSYEKIALNNGDTVKVDHFFAVSKDKLATLFSYIRDAAPKKAIIFVNTKVETEKLRETLYVNGFDVLSLNGDMTQSQRERIIRDFSKNGGFLVATNLASRGLDLKDVTHIINFDLPDQPETYIHRVGRTARMEKTGKAFSIVENDRAYEIANIERKTGIMANLIDVHDSDYRKPGKKWNYRRYSSDKKIYNER
ncbi:DEAD/DEAH box helicase [Caldiplasma sukawensis]